MKIYVIAHKPVELPVDNDLYEILQVNAFNNQHFSKCRDDFGTDNISK